ncbi:MAG TPA: sulfurtransferase TusA family protein [Nitrospiria bacterium]|nr:sulfurtransferase TusA family protein [Nitrospiria bacterium]
MSIEINVKLDCKGLSCPLPVLKTKKAIDGMKIGQILEMTATDPGSQNDMVAWSHRTGQEILSQQQAGGAFIFYIKKVK